PNSRVAGRFPLNACIGEGFVRKQNSMFVYKRIGLTILNCTLLAESISRTSTSQSNIPGQSTILTEHRSFGACCGGTSSRNDSDDKRAKQVSTICLWAEWWGETVSRGRLVVVPLTMQDLRSTLHGSVSKAEIILWIHSQRDLIVMVHVKTVQVLTRIALVLHGWPHMSSNNWKTHGASSIRPSNPSTGCSQLVCPAALNAAIHYESVWRPVGILQHKVLN
ncbi:hypothetical protein CBL_21124, partial [Carabus blaptoides fortunei]